MPVAEEAPVGLVDDEVATAFELVVGGRFTPVAVADGVATLDRLATKMCTKISANWCY